MNERAKSGVAFSHMQVIAGLSVIALVCVTVWQIAHGFGKENTVRTKNTASSSLPEQASTPYGSINWQAPLTLDTEGLISSDDPEGIGNIGDNVVGALMGSYVTLAESGAYTPEEGERIAEDIAGTLRASVTYGIYAVADIKTDSDTSYERMLSYRNDLRTALEPLLENPGYEFALFANYIETGDTAYLEQLRTTAQNYAAAIGNAKTVVVPEDAVSQHIEVLNALSQFGATIEKFTKHGGDAFASAALLRTYNESEARLFVAFDALATYQKQKPS